VYIFRLLYKNKFIDKLKNKITILIRMKTNGIEKLENVELKFVCDFCNYKCSRKHNYYKHLTTVKHKMETTRNEKTSNVGTEINNTPSLFIQTTEGLYDCLCKKKFKSNSGLWKHKRNCKVILDSEIDKESELVWFLVKQNQEFKDMMMEQQNYMMELAKNSNTTNVYNNSNNTNNTQNNQFNLQFFLNETCKDAMNINQFIDSIQIQLEDLDYTGKYGYVKGLSNVIVRELKALDQKVRPMHCSDEKREVIYIKTNDVWEKDIDYARVTRFTKHLAHKKFLKIKEWVEEYPTCMANDDKKNDDYLNILGQITSSFTHLNGSECQESMKKIIKAIAKQAIIQKNISN